jgi:hypothetical protein
VNADVGVGSLRIGKAFADLNLDRGSFNFGPDIDELGRNEACAT